MKAVEICLPQKVFHFKRFPCRSRYGLGRNTVKRRGIALEGTSLVGKVAEARTLVWAATPES